MPRGPISLQWAVIESCRHFTLPTHPHGPAPYTVSHLLGSSQQSLVRIKHCPTAVRIAEAGR